MSVVCTACEHKRLARRESRVSFSEPVYVISGKTLIYVEWQQTALNPVTHNSEDFIPLLQQEQSAAFYMLYLLRSWCYLWVQPQVRSCVAVPLLYRHTDRDLEGQLSQDDRRDAVGSKDALGRKVHASTSPGQQQILHSIDHLFLSPSLSLFHGAYAIGSQIWAYLLLSIRRQDSNHRILEWVSEWAL